MKELLLRLAKSIDARVGDYQTSYPRTQTTDAMIALGTDIANIIRAEGVALKAEPPSELEKIVEAAVTKCLKEVTARAAPKKSKPKKEGE